ncbi:hypothetical protein BC829DRAFT_397152 [Chytridium lagenaria]|nr:hypothetical protein BC829DRAFT_397152 [Chytridium lagenaria]
MLSTYDSTSPHEGYEDSALSLAVAAEALHLNGDQGHSSGYLAPTESQKKLTESNSPCARVTYNRPPIFIPPFHQSNCFISPPSNYGTPAPAWPMAPPPVTPGGQQQWQHPVQFGGTLPFGCIQFNPNPVLQPVGHNSINQGYRNSFNNISMQRTSPINVVPGLSGIPPPSFYPIPPYAKTPYAMMPPQLPFTAAPSILSSGTPHKTGLPNKRPVGTYQNVHPLAHNLPCSSKNVSHFVYRPNPNPTIATAQINVETCQNIIHGNKGLGQNQMRPNGIDVSASESNVGSTVIVASVPLQSSSYETLPCPTPTIDIANNIESPCDSITDNGMVTNDNWSSSLIGHTHMNDSKLYGTRGVWPCGFSVSDVNVKPYIVTKPCGNTSVMMPALRYELPSSLSLRRTSLPTPGVSSENVETVPSMERFSKDAGTWQWLTFGHAFPHSLFTDVFDHLESVGFTVRGVCSKGCCTRSRNPLPSVNHSPMYHILSKVLICSSSSSPQLTDEYLGELIDELLKKNGFRYAGLRFGDAPSPYWRSITVQDLEDAEYSKFEGKWMSDVAVAGYRRTETSYSL